MSTKSLLVISGVVNAVLAAGLACLLATRPAKAPLRARSRPAADTGAAQGAVAFAKPARPPNLTPAKPGVQFDWRLVESADYRQYIANLRAIGCPEETIRDIIIADVNKLFQSRSAALGKPGVEFKYWKTGAPMPGLMPDEETLKNQQELAREKRALLRELLGVDAAGEAAAGAGGLSATSEMLGFLSPEKQSRVMELEQQYAAKLAKSMQGGPPDGEDLAAIGRIQKEKLAELAKVLTPAELEDYELRMSQTAMMMRFQLDGFDATEQEFRDIFKLQKKFDEENSPFALDPADPGSFQQREAAQKQLNEQIKQVLGESRYEEYERAQDLAYKGALKVAERQGLGVETAQQVWDFKQAAEVQAGQVRANAALSDEQRKITLRAIQAEAEKAVAGALGQPGFAAYQKQMGGNWLRALDALTPPPAAARMDAVIIAAPAP